ncbi:chromo domain-containing protein [Candidatus Bathyarchaeota archaeon]|nr:chromo domain-containing protein [Candidatus Bathyarchaeota archaeon]
MVEKIIGHEDREIHGNVVRWYHIRWEGYQPKDDTIEPSYHLLHAKEMVWEYMDNL